jgi:hypothetical protein
MDLQKNDRAFRSQGVQGSQNDQSLCSFDVDFDEIRSL